MMNLWEKKLYFVFDELMEKKYQEKNNSIEYIRKNRLKYPNQTDKFDSDLFLKNTKNRTKPIDDSFARTMNSLETNPIIPLDYFKKNTNKAGTIYIDCVVH
jgi:hypothetical protein